MADISRTGVAEPSAAPGGTPQSDPAQAAVLRRAYRGEFLRFVAVKFSGALVSLVMVVLTSFFIFRVLAGDPVDAVVGDTPATPEQVAAIRERLGLDEPMGVQFWEYLRSLFTMDWGTSYVSDKKVTTLLWERLPATVLLTATAMILAAAFGTWVGARSGWRRGSTGEKVQVGVSLTLWSTPTFWLGMIAIVAFSVKLGWFPVNGMHSTRGVGDGFWDEFFDVAHHLVLPALTMAAVLYAQYVLIMRTSILEERGNDYLTVARAKGLRDDHVRRLHAVPNALLPTITLAAAEFGTIFNGSVLTETVFSWPGLGLTFYQAIKIPDIPLLQLLFVFFAGTTVLVNFLAEIFYRFLDPRVRRSA
ncbi:Dipeptide transport system permease protein DppB [Streptomyces sp. RB5]|uniref:Dipeptide transport system permease protein DppB n=1 Tax=Streptomyces smaragdinus TaxID=2585196 RepID=A0A7K0CTN8_9ACTN|nr:ABC transporter permease [Streptomyces smaragdinus]MQY16855.1 Dipeptide transport system permease protein DppB [Streptomyces smaragdinus]